jgi:hypothetical protein
MTEHEQIETSNETVSLGIADFDPNKLIAAFPDWTWEKKVFVQVFSGSKRNPQKVESGWLFRTDIGLIQLTKEPAGALIIAQKSESQVKDIERISISTNSYCSSIIFDGRRRQLIYERFKDSNNSRIHINNINEDGKIEYSDHVYL